MGKGKSKSRSCAVFNSRAIRSIVRPVGPYYYSPDPVATSSQTEKKDPPNCGLSFSSSSFQIPAVPDSVGQDAENFLNSLPTEFKLGKLAGISQENAAEGNNDERNEVDNTEPDPFAYQPPSPTLIQNGGIGLPQGNGVNGTGDNDGVWAAASFEGHGNANGNGGGNWLAYQNGGKTSRKSGGGKKRKRDAKDVGSREQEEQEQLGYGYRYGYGYDDGYGFYDSYSAGLDLPTEIEGVKQFKKRSEVPAHLLKYWHQRHRLFSSYDEGILLDTEGWWSVTPELIAAQIAERCRSNVVVDAFCGVGGNAIQFALTCERVIALDTNPLRLRLAAHNAKIYGVQDRIEFICADYVQWAKELAEMYRNESVPVEEDVNNTVDLDEAEEGEVEEGGSGAQKNQRGDRKGKAKRRGPPLPDVIFLSPPWGGPDYLASSPTKPTAPSMTTIINDVPSTPTPLMAKTTTGTEAATTKPSSSSSSPQSEPFSYFPLESLEPLPAKELFEISRALTPNVAMYLPRNVDVRDLAQLVQSPGTSSSTKSNPTPTLIPTAPKAGEALQDGVVDENTAEDVEIEEEWMGGKLKAVVAYFGALSARATS